MQVPPLGVQLGRPEMRLVMGPEMLAFFWTVFWTWISETVALLRREVVAVQDDAGVGGVVAEVHCSAPGSTLVYHLPGVWPPIA